MGGSRNTWSGKVMVLMCLFLPMSSADAQRITGQSAAEAFSKDNFSSAYEQYTTLLGSFPRDPAYLYGAGVSLIRLSVKPEEATDLLSRAIAASSSVRSAPADTRFFLARALHLSGRFDEAIREYEKYADAAGRREARDRGLAGFIAQCNNRNGMLADARPITDVSELRAAVPTLKPDTAKHVDPVIIPPVIRVTPPDTLPKHTDTLLTDALLLRKNIDTTDKGVIRKSDSLLIVAGVPVLQATTVQPDLTRPVAEVAKIPVADSVKIVAEAQIADSLKSGVKSSESPPGQEKATAVKPVQPVTSLFALKDTPYYSRANPVTVSTAFPPGLLYTVQLAVFRNPVEPSHFKRLYPVFGVKIPGRELTTYYSGLFRTMVGASKSLQSVRNEGFSDAFVAILMDGKAVSAERGAILEKEWGTKALPTWAGVVPAVAVTVIAADTVPPTLLFRVEVMRTNKEDNKQLIEEISRVAGDRGFEIMNPATGIYVYLVGKFLTFESASTYADLLRRNGYKEAKVVAYAGSMEIPIEVALKLFERKN